MESNIGQLPDQALLYIFTCVNQYSDLDSVRLVCRRWYFLANKAVDIMKRAFRRCDQLKWYLFPHLNSITGRYMHSCCYHENSKSMFVFGGCTENFTVFNDLWQLDLNRRCWERVVIRSSPFPSPKASATLVPYGDDILLYGGFSESTPNPIRRIKKFYDEVHLFKFSERKWIELVPENEGPKLAGHCSAIVKDSMIIFGGASENSPMDKIFVFDIGKCRWWSPNVTSRNKPAPRCNHSCALIDDNHLLIIGGRGFGTNLCGAGNEFNEVWLLTFDLGQIEGWEWSEIKVVGYPFPRNLWLHPACKVGQNIVALGPSSVRKEELTFAQAMSKNATSFCLNSTEVNTYKASDEKHCVSLKSKMGVTSMQRRQRSSNGDSSFSNTVRSSENSGTNEVSSTYVNPFGPSCSKSVTGDISTENCPGNRNQLVKKLRKDSFKIHSDFVGWWRKRLYVYILNISLPVLRKLRWRRQLVEFDAPSDTIAYSICAGRGELIVFGGLVEDSSSEKQLADYFKSGSLSICHITAELKEELKRFRFNKSEATNVLILKINRDNHELELEEKYEDCELENVCNELPSQQPRYILISYKLAHSDGRFSYPMCLIFYTPTGSSPEMQMLYAGSRNNLIKECQLTKNLEIRDVEELTKELLDSKLR